MTQKASASSPAERAAEQAALPLLAFDRDGGFLWANTQAEEWLGLSARHLRRGRFAEHSRSCGQLMEIVDQARSSQRTVVALGRGLGTSRLQDVHVRWTDEVPELVVSVLPHTELGSRASEAPALGFGRMLAHELKNPLASVRGAAQLIRREGDPDAARQLAAMIVEDVDRITRLADHWSRVGDIRMGDTSRLSLNRIAVDAVASLGRANPAVERRVAEDFDPSLPEFSGDRDLLLQAVLNLLQNAVDAVSGVEHPVIRVETRFDAGPRSRTGADPAPLVLVVRDNGPGIPDTLGPGIFTPFVTTKPAGEGLGLAFSARIAALHGGQLDYESVPGDTRFNLRLPVAREN